MPMRGSITAHVTKLPPGLEHANTLRNGREGGRKKTNHDTMAKRNKASAASPMSFGDHLNVGIRPWFRHKG